MRLAYRVGAKLAHAIIADWKAGPPVPSTRAVDSYRSKHRFTA